eukprot:CAMPEP_0197074746 /NCGR_PEP_ID=MMETSP1384-20130603/211263_1 /TAXON_ID=29189 /ORGANISM="Ammonia sp." /LENGTH=192 /DNA_ID=CAMNT_0042513587 /DNA_START=85 /DNA_END=663 /DNA_ORIENTATION=+
MQVKYSVTNSSIPNAGNGLFAQRFIPKGSVVWAFDRDNLVVYTRKGIETYLASLPYEKACKYAAHVYRDTVIGNEYAVYELDDGRYFNHSKGIETYLASLPYEKACKYAAHVYRDTVIGNEYAVYELDDGRYFNHSGNPNVANQGENCVAARDIQRGEELLIDYEQLYPRWLHILHDKYNVFRPQVSLKSQL